MTKKQKVHKERTGLKMFLTLLFLPMICLCACMSSAAVSFVGIASSMLGGSTSAILGTDEGLVPGCFMPGFDDPKGLGGGGAAGESFATLNEAQKRNAQAIIGAGEQRQVHGYGIMIALMTAMQESRLLNLASRANPVSLNYPHDAVASGDHDSVGLFQQRDGWGPMEVRMNPTGSANMFFMGGENGQRGLLDIPGWMVMSPGAAAQAVQVSAFPDAYAKWEQLARDIMGNLAGTIGTGSWGSGGMLCGNGTGMDCPPTNFNAERGLTPDALRVIRCTHLNYPDIKVYHGVGLRSGPSDHPSGRAIDAMIPSWDTTSGNAYGWSVANWVRTNAAALGVTYVIFDVKIWSVKRDAEGWRVYTAGRGDPTSDHKDHVHVSVHGNAATGSGEWGKPISGGYRISSHFGHCEGVHAGDCHAGTDLAASEGTPIVAASAGTVIFAGWNAGGYGNLVKIRHADGTITYYAHQSRLTTSMNAKVALGQKIGEVGDTGHSFGAHLHFEVRPNGGAPVDAEAFLAKNGVNL